jgi:Bacterial SH3 domain
MRANWLLSAIALPAVLSAQATLTATSELRSAPDGRILAELRKGATVRPGAAKGAWTQITVEGYLYRELAGAKRDTFPISVEADGGALLRAEADRHARVVAQLEDGLGLQRVSRSGDWLLVRRSGWLPTKRLSRGSADSPGRAASKTAAKAVAKSTARSAPEASADSSREAAPQPVAGAAGDVVSGDYALARRATLSAAPLGRGVAALDSGARVTTLARERGWVRVRVEGWVREDDVVPTDTSVLSNVSAADLRSQPEKFRGRTVRWKVQVLSLQTADPLRRDLAPDELYWLARGPGSENSLLYLALPPSLVGTARSVEPLSSVIVTARVRTGRSEPSGVPVLDIQSIVGR